jgi:hypothetical protein
MAFFWMSHGGFKRIRGNQNSAIKPSAILFDHQKYNVAKAFQTIHPNIKYISIIGCNSAQILEGTLKSREDLGAYVSTKKVITTWALRKAIRKFKKHYWTYKYNYLAEDIYQAGIKIKVNRIVKTDSKSLKFFAGTKLIGIMPKLNANQEQTFEYYIPYSEDLGKHNLKLVSSSGQSAEDETDNFGEMTISSSDKNLWQFNKYYRYILVFLREKLAFSTLYRER